MFKRQNENSTKEEIKKHFDFFMENIPHHLEIARNWLNKPMLEFSLQEIDDICLIYNYLFKISGKMPGAWYQVNYEVYVTYIGEAFRKYFGGNWKVNELKKTFGYGYPFVFILGEEKGLFNPIDVTSYLLSIENGDEEPLSMIFTRLINFYKN